MEGPAAIVGSSKIDGVILHDLQNEVSNVIIAKRKERQT